MMSPWMTSNVRRCSPSRTSSSMRSWIPLEIANSGFLTSCAMFAAISPIAASLSCASRRFCDARISVTSCSRHTKHARFPSESRTGVMMASAS